MKKRKAGAVLEKILTAFLIVIFLISISLLLMQVLYKNRLPKVFGMAQIIVISGSMEPAINAGDFLIIREETQYTVNDIITYRDGNSLITHRVKSIDGTNLVTQGDANNVADSPVSLSQVEGKVFLRIPKLGSALLFLKTPPGILVLVLVCILLIEVPHIADRRRHKKKHR
jgi:signal peptidase